MHTERDEIPPWDLNLIQRICKKHGLKPPELGIYKPRPKTRKKPDRRTRSRRRRRSYIGSSDHEYPGFVVRLKNRQTLSMFSWTTNMNGDHDRDDEESGEILLQAPRYSYNRRFAFRVGKVYSGEHQYQLSGRRLLIAYTPGDKLSYIPGLVVKAISEGKINAVWDIIVELFRNYFSDDIITHPPDPVIGMEGPREAISGVLKLKMKKGSHMLGLARRHFLLMGPPGNGKSLLLRHICYDIGEKAIIVYVRGFEQFERWMPVVSTMARLVKMNVVVVADEIDEMARHREKGGRTFEFLRLMDGVAAMHNVVFLATTNRPDLLDPALLRPERFSPVYFIGWPDTKARKALLGLYIRRFGKVRDPKLTELAKKTKGWCCAELRAVVEDVIYEVGGDEAKFSVAKVEKGIARRSKEAKRVYEYWNRLYDTWRKDAFTSTYHA